MYTLYQSGAGCILVVKAVMGEILGIGPMMGCIPCVREVRCGILGVTSKPVMPMVLCQKYL